MAYQKLQVAHNIQKIQVKEEGNINILNLVGGGK
jgi:hypothetical protein